MSARFSVSDGNAVAGYALKADIKHYFDTVDHGILLNIVRSKIKDQNVIWLIKQILKNHKTKIPENNHELRPWCPWNKVPSGGMPLGNLTSQFFANVYLDELDYFVKHELKAKYYIRYVDDFVLLHRDRKVLEKWKSEIDAFLKEKLELELHPEKSKIIPLRNGITLLGFRVFYHHRLLKKSNSRRIWKRLEKFKQKYEDGEMEREEIVQSMKGWFAYTKFANTYNLRKLGL